MTLELCLRGEKGCERLFSGKEQQVGRRKASCLEAEALTWWTRAGWCPYCGPRAAMPPSGGRCSCSSEERAGQGPPDSLGQGHSAPFRSCHSPTHSWEEGKLALKPPDRTLKFPPSPKCDHLEDGMWPPFETATWPNAQ